jgi:carboxyl-terminal processing protease
MGEPVQSRVAVVTGRRTLSVLAGLLAVAGSFAVGFELRARSVAAPTPPRLQRPLTVRGEVLGELRAHYFREVPTAGLRARSVAGLLRALDDPYTRYLGPLQFQRLRDTEAGRFSGLGLAVARARGHGLVVTASLAGLPGRLAGILPGDVITTINGAALASLSYHKALDLFAGAPGSYIRLAVTPGGAGTPRELTLVRRSIAVPAATSRRLARAGGYFRYIRLLDFQDRTAARVRALARLALREHDRGVVLDLRGNPGGLLTEAVGVVRVFVRSGTIVTTAGLHEPRQVFAANHTAVGRLPVAVLIDAATASAAEVVAGALRERGAIVVGHRSYGKGTVQSVVGLRGGGALKLTVARFELRGGEPVEGRGVRPTVPVKVSAGQSGAALAAALKALSAR